MVQATHEPTWPWLPTAGMFGRRSTVVGRVRGRNTCWLAALTRWPPATKPPTGWGSDRGVGAAFAAVLGRTMAQSATRPIRPCLNLGWERILAPHSSGGGTGLIGAAEDS